MHRRMARAWRAGRAEDGLRRALVLLADHELNASTFAARVATSTGAPLAAGLIAGLATLSGPLHGGAIASVRALIAAAQRAGPDAAARDWLAQGRKLPAFGHPLYPNGDPRATALCRDARGHRGADRRGAECRFRPRRFRRRVRSSRGGSVHDFRHGPLRRLDRACDRAGAERPSHPAARKVHRPGARGRTLLPAKRGEGGAKHRMGGGAGLGKLSAGRSSAEFGAAPHPAASPPPSPRCAGRGVTATRLAGGLLSSGTKKSTCSGWLGSTR